MIRRIRKNKISHTNPHYSKLFRKLEKMIDRWEEAKMTDTYIFLSNPRKTIWANIVIGISRGVGFVIGVSIIGVFVLTILGSILSKFVTVPVLGEFIALVVEHVQNYLGNNSSYP